MSHLDDLYAEHAAAIGDLGRRAPRVIAPPAPPAGDLFGVVWLWISLAPLIVAAVIYLGQMLERIDTLDREVYALRNDLAVVGSVLRGRR